ncbi:MAG TPA: SgcJ/EcaC family oxidoreductase [Candidatus Acidoferrales bacterium]|jgi:uncharacterized protein (TIGR02246 family)|nr:SgcJ/EcaC family oxidoreductase [Candidatus Acidoferrales bacterium]
MFERYTEKARRVIFFARYAASEYGSHTIESEHLLLGLLQEDGKLVQRFLGLPTTTGVIKKEIEAQVKKGRQFGTNVEVPLSAECQRILCYAPEETKRLGHIQIGMEHLLLGILREEKCLAARILAGHGMKAAAVREALLTGTARETKAKLGPVVDELVVAWQAHDAEKVAALFGEHGQFWDAHGERWLGRAEIQKGIEREVSMFEKGLSEAEVKDVKFVGMDTAVVTIAWEARKALKKGGPSGLRMVVVMAGEWQGWSVATAHLAEIRAGKRSKS